MVPQWLELALGVKQALSCTAFELRRADLEFDQYVFIRGQVTSPFSALPAQRIWPTNETMSYDRVSTTCVCVCEYTHCNANAVHFFVIWITIRLLVL